MSNEGFIMQLRTMIAVMDRIRTSVSEEIVKLDETAKRLEDESRLGAASAFDFGMDDQHKAAERVKKEISKALREIKKLSKDLEEDQTKKMAEKSSSMTDMPDK